ncbi:MAG: outer membrane beta-barrel protein, partial [Pseudomonadota bacterium]
EVQNSPITPYIGAGIGVGFVDVDYSPSGVGIISDDDTRFAYQAMAGASYAMTEQTALFGEVSYRGTTDVEVTTVLFPGELDIENRGVTAEVGVRFTF